MYPVIGLVTVTNVFFNFNSIIKHCIQKTILRDDILLLVIYYSITYSNTLIRYVELTFVTFNLYLVRTITYGEFCHECTSRRY